MYSAGIILNPLNLLTMASDIPVGQNRHQERLKKKEPITVNATKTKMKIQTLSIVAGSSACNARCP
jgi:hypothetical protein